MKRIENYYFKSGVNISGVNPPERDCHFVGCTFHPNTWEVPFENCIFEDCDLDKAKLLNATNISFFYM